MTDTDRGPVPVQVTGLEQIIKNYADKYIKPKYIRKTTLKTVIIDPLGIAGPKASLQLCEYEPSRVRIAIRTFDQPIAVSTDPQVNNIDSSGDSAHAPQQGIYIDKVSSGCHITEFFGPDSLWATSVTNNGSTRITIIKEYC